MVNFMDYQNYAEGTYAVLQSTPTEKRALKELVGNALMLLDGVDDEEKTKLAETRIEHTVNIYGEKNTVRAFMLLMYIFRIIPGLATRYFNTPMPFETNLIDKAGQDVRETFMAYVIAAARPDQYSGKTPLVQKFPDIEGKIYEDYNEHALYMTTED